MSFSTTKPHLSVWDFESVPPPPISSFQSLTWMTSTAGMTILLAFQGMWIFGLERNNVPCYAVYASTHGRLSCKSYENTTQLQKRKEELLEKHQESNKSRQCTMLLISNLATPVWVAIECKDKLLPNVVCSSAENMPHQSYSALPISNKGKLCGPTEVQMNASCFWFTLQNVTNSIKHFSLQLETKGMKIQECILASFGKMLHPTETYEFSFLFDSQSIHKTQESFMFYNYQSNKVFNTYNEEITEFAASSISCGQYRYLCTTATRILYKIDKLKWTALNGSGCHMDMMKKLHGHLVYRSTKFVCSFSHEILWETASSESTVFCTCNTTANISALFYTDKLKKCRSYTSKGSAEHTITHYSSDKGQVDLQDSSSVDMEQQNKLQKTIDFSCSDPNYLPCGMGISACYHLNQICIYTLTHKTNLSPCSTGSHLQDCKQFTCRIQLFKCIIAYCIHSHYLCDGKWDCPHGDDEANTTFCQMNCVGKMKCFTGESNFSCVSVDGICNGVQDCPQGDDEYLCLPRKHTCPQICICLNVAILCTGQRARNILGVVVGLTSFCVSCSVADTILDANVNRFIHAQVRFLNLSNNKISDVCGICRPSEVQLMTIDISHNVILELQCDCVCNFTHLRVFNLKSNLLSKVKVPSFRLLPSLQEVNLEDNSLFQLPKGLFQFVPQLLVLNIMQNPLIFIDVNMFVNLNIQTTLTDSYQVCCVKPPGSHCSADIPSYASCSNLLPSFDLHICFLVVAISVLVFNTVEA